MIYINTLVPSNSETSILKLLPKLKEEGYFKKDADEWINRIQNCGFEQSNRIILYDCGHKIRPNVSCNATRVCQSCSKKYKAKTKAKIGQFLSGWNSERMRARFFTMCPRNYTTEEVKTGQASKDIARYWQNIRKNVNFPSMNIRKEYLKICRKHGWRYNRYNLGIGKFVAVKEFEFHKEGEPVIDKDTKEVIGIYDQDQWNVHMHVVYEGTFLPQELISKVMKNISKGKSYRNTFRKIDPNTGFGWVKTANYLSKYIGKVSTTHKSVDVKLTYLLGTKNTKLVTFSTKSKQEKLPALCPECYQGTFIETYSVKEYTLEFQPVKNEFFERLKQTLLEESNIDALYEKFSQKEIEYATKNGLIYQVRPDRYEILE